MLKVIEHGGRLAQLAEQTQRPLEQWLDLSTGISPWSWPVPELPAYVWQQLPNDHDKLEVIAQQYYQAKSRPLAVPGSQWLIRQLPRALVNNAAVALPQRGYQEHLLAWQSQGYQICFYSDWADLQRLMTAAGKNIGYVVVINPNNPSAEKFLPQALYDLEQQLAKRQGLLVVDEAFIDTVPDHSLLHLSTLTHAVVLRSLGKFFGLAGLRLGFGFLPPSLRRVLALECQPWAVSHPARYIGQRCLQDVEWQGMQRRRLKTAAANLACCLSVLDKPLALTDYFISLEAEPDYIETLHQHLLQQGIYIRRFEVQGDLGMLRFGLCESQKLRRIEQALEIFKDK